MSQLLQHPDFFLIDNLIPDDTDLGITTYHIIKKISTLISIVFDHWLGSFGSPSIYFQGF